MKLKCAGCGKTEKVSFRTWWFYFWMDLPHPYPHLKCWMDMQDQKRIDGV